MPYGFAVSGLLLGTGGVVMDRPLAGACGAVAGVTVGLLERHRADVADRRSRRLRHLLRDERAEAELAESELRREIQALRTALWQRDLRDLGVATEPAAAPVAAAPAGAGTAAAPGAAHEPTIGWLARVIDLGQARGQAEPAAAAEPAPDHRKGRAAG